MLLVLTIVYYGDLADPRNLVYLHLLLPEAWYFYRVNA